MARGRKSAIRPLTIAGLLAAGNGCNPFPVERTELAVDCTVGDAYDLTSRPIKAFEEGEDCSWFGASDPTGLVDCDHPQAGAEQTVETEVDGGGTQMVPTGLCDGPRRAVAASSCEALPDGPRCGSAQALHLTGSRNNDWGSLWGDYNLAGGMPDATAYEGLAFWARAEPGTQKSFMILLDDQYTANIDGQEPTCVEEENVAGGQSQSEQNTQLPGQNSDIIPGAVPSEDACGNSHQRLLTVTDRWQLYLLPFDSFDQEALPNRRLEGIDRSTLRGTIVRAPKDTVVDLWIDDITYYRPID